MEQLPGSNLEAKLKTERGKKKNMHQGVPARYDIYAGDDKKRAVMDSPQFCDHDRFAKLYTALRNAEKKRRTKK